jgi:hypothetical protein
MHYHSPTAPSYNYGFSNGMHTMNNGMSTVLNTGTNVATTGRLNDLVQAASQDLASDFIEGDCTNDQVDDDRTVTAPGSGGATAAT